MKQLILFEIKKIFRNKLMLVILLLGLVLNAFMITVQDKVKVASAFTDAKAQIYQKVSGEITQEKYDFINEEYQKAKKIVDGGNYDTKTASSKFYTGYIFGDMNLFHEFLVGYDYAIDYNDKIASALDLAHKNITYYKDSQDIAFNQKFIQTFENRGLGYYSDTDNMTKFLSHDFSTFLIVILLIIVLSGIFSEDIEYSYYQILNPTQGRRKLYLSRMYTVILLTFILCTLFFLEDFIVYKSIGILDGFSNPIYSLPVFQYSSISCSIFTFMVLNDIARLLVLIMTSFIVVLCSILNKKVLVSLLTAFGIIFILLYFSSWIVNPYHLLLLRENLYTYQMAQVFHTYIPGVYIAIASIIVEFIVIMILTFTVMQRRGGKKHVQSFQVGNNKSRA